MRRKYIDNFADDTGYKTERNSNNDTEEQKIPEGSVIKRNVTVADSEYRDYYEVEAVNEGEILQEGHETHIDNNDEEKENTDYTQVEILWSLILQKFCPFHQPQHNRH